MNEELKTALETLKTELEGKGKDQAQGLIDAFAEKHKEVLEADTKSLIKAEIKTIKR